MKPLEDMTELQLRDLTTYVLRAVESRLPPDVGFCVLFWPQGKHQISHYGSNCRRADMVLALREAADRLERREDVPR